jgi:hypothetical protein
MKTRELTGAALDWAVAKAEGLTYWDDDRLCFANELHGEDFEPSTNWAQGGAIIERERICLIDQGGDYWRAMCGWKESFGDTPLIAAMRVYVAFQLGDEVDVPKELL